MTTTIVGNTTADPQLRYTQTGKAVTSLTVAVSKRRKDETGNWIDGEPTFIRCSIWGKPAEHVASSVHKGTRVIVTGELKQSTWQTEQGEKRSSIELNAANIGIDLTFSPARVTRTSGRGQPASQSHDAWAASVQARADAPSQGWSDAPYDEEVPF